VFPDGLGLIPMNLVFANLKLCLGGLEELSAFDLFLNDREILPAFGLTIDSMRDKNIPRVDGRKTMAGCPFYPPNILPFFVLRFLVPEFFP